MNVLFNINPLNTEIMNTDYLSNKIDEAEKGFDEWFAKQITGLSAEQKDVLMEKVNAAKNAVKTTIAKSVKEFNSIVDAVKQTAGTFPGSKLAIEFTERKAQQIFDKVLSESWAFLKSQIPLIIPKGQK